MAFPFVRSPHHTPGAGRTIDLVVIHTMEVPERPGAARVCAAWFASPESEVSAHYCVDADTVVQCVREADVAWHARGANGRSVGVELAGFARQDAVEWADSYSAATLGRAAPLVAAVCARHGIPVSWLEVEQVRAGAAGITGHAQVSEAYGRSDHWDPGPGFPSARFVAAVRAASRRRRARRRGRPAAPRARPPRS